MCALHAGLFRNFRVLLLLATVFLLASFVTAQDPVLVTPHISPRVAPAVTAYAAPTASVPSISARPMRVDVNLVLVPVTVVDAYNRPVINLPQQNFTLLEGGQPQKIQYFTHEDGPISV
ncbi:MAG TPA: hypothetical protein VE779_13775, partial [Candidatus Angelobacter sp.]|nr:hypothetical protein [Candidatus Angelobacter sp.]